MDLAATSGVLEILEHSNVLARREKGVIGIGYKVCQNGPTHVSDSRMYLRIQWNQTYQRKVSIGALRRCRNTYMTGLSGLFLKYLSQSSLNSGPISFNSCSVGRILSDAK